MASIKLYKRSKKQPCYRLSYKDSTSGLWKQKLLHCSRDEADEIRKRIDAEYAWYQLHPELVNKQEHIPLSVAKKRFLSAKLHLIAYSTYKRYERVFKSFENHVGEIYIQEISSSVISKYAAEMLEDRVAAGINLDLRHLKAFLRYCHSEDMISKVPKIEMIKEKKRPVYFITKEQYQEWYNSTEILGKDTDMVRDIATIVLMTAARISEILSAKWEQIDLDAGVIHLYDLYSDDVSDKTNSGGKLYLNQKACDILSKYKENLPGPYPVTYDWFEWRMRRVSTEAGFRLRPHDLRKTAGSWLVQDGVDIYRVSKFMRHTSVVVTEKHYADLMSDQHHETADQMATFL
ncbi:MAG: site-specific integrase [Candidatus Marinimicrobia bacterium]|nr:site-specific integrase [Candidatus Neomarinimicrobiota bacterium]MBT4360972.1 site-specific integrase [Candidatus Neomarinimicrobiota bacterium]MBT4714849.1 site-specific integrase [Candidatus Neomarinimicrobiota bacterium]MBT4947295.1 site-specific integrase [Candidatus Neomarinimicrobiota bacterium]MBT5268202.1 site-specific integrase [Candidatus Neomarinimicrobiota bacterium]